MIIDVSAFVGPYPYRELPWCSAAELVATMDRVGIDTAWVGYLPAMLHQEPRAANTALARAVHGYGDRLVPVPVVQPDLPDWETDLDRAVGGGAPAVRVYPMHAAMAPAGEGMQRLARAAGERGLALVITVRFEDQRQRHPLDVAADVPAAAVRTLARSGDRTRLLVTHAGRDFIEEVHFGLTDEEAARVLWDVTWLWGPPTDELTTLLDTVGVDRFAFGTSMPLRLPEATIAKLDLAGIGPDARTAVESVNLTRWQS